MSKKRKPDGPALVITYLPNGSAIISDVLYRGGRAYPLKEKPPTPDRSCQLGLALEAQ